MPSKDINTVTASTILTNSDYIFISKEGINLQRIAYNDFVDQLYNSGIFLSNVSGNASGAHNSIFRGKDLGEEFTSAQSTEIAAGRFTDLFIGDYWTINGRQYRIAAFDPYYRCGDNASLGHHIAVISNGVLYNAQMHSTQSGVYVSGNENNTTTNAYVGSDMRINNLSQATDAFEEDFGLSHILTYRDMLPNSTGSYNGYSCQATGAAWCDCSVELMSETMVYGNAVWGISGFETSCYNSQFPLFKLAPDMIHIRSNWWLRNTANATSFSLVSSTGSLTYEPSSYPRGVRPFALIA